MTRNTRLASTVQPPSTNHLSLSAARLFCLILYNTAPLPPRVSHHTPPLPQHTRTRTPSAKRCSGRHALSTRSRQIVIFLFYFHT